MRHGAQPATTEGAHACHRPRATAPEPPPPSHRPCATIPTKPLACVVMPLVPSAPRVGRGGPWPRTRRLGQLDEAGALRAVMVLVVVELLLAALRLLCAEG